MAVELRCNFSESTTKGCNEEEEYGKKSEISRKRSLNIMKLKLLKRDGEKHIYVVLMV